MADDPARQRRRPADQGGGGVIGVGLDHLGLGAGEIPGPDPARIGGCQLEIRFGEPGALEDAARPRAGPLLQLCRRGIGSEPLLQIIDLPPPHPLRPQQLAELLARVAEPALRMVGLELGRQAQHRPWLDRVLLQHVAHQVVFVHPLLHQHVGAGLLVVQPRGQRLVPPFEGAGPRLLRLRGPDVVRVIDDDDVAALAGGGAADRGGQPVAGFVVLEAATWCSDPRSA